MEGQRSQGKDVVGMLEHIKEETVAEMHSAIDDERSAQAAFESTMTALTKQEQELVDGINTYKQALADTETSIEEAHENLASTERDHAAIVAYLAAIEPDCTFYITNYETRKQSRESEKAALEVGVEKLEASPVFKNAVAAQEREEIAVISAYLGASVTDFLDDFRQGKAAAYNPAKKMLSSGVDVVPDFEVPAVDRNRTSPFPFGGHRFEFRAVGSSQNVSFVNTVLATMSAASFKEFADAIEGGKKPEDVAKEALNKHWRVIFDGNGYDPAWLDEADKRGIWRIDSGVEAVNMMSSEKNIKLFQDMKVLSKEELIARRDIKLQHYAGIVEMEALCFIDMVKQSILPAIKEAEQDTKGVMTALAAVEKGLAAMHHEGRSRAHV